MQRNSNERVLGAYGLGTISIPADIRKKLKLTDGCILVFTCNEQQQEIIIKKRKFNGKP
jgi:bifunctional DNA-binding transcriptional regulator/antitoxin component of YhaV-PrlF toxin-antitoxin module